MKKLTPVDERKAFVDSFNQLSRRHGRFNVFGDFVTMSAISLHNAVCFDQKLEDEYLKTVERYDRSDINIFPALLGHTINLLEPEPTDILGSLFMELELGNKHTGQVFTPSSISELVSQVLTGDLKQLGKPYISLSDPCCGAGSLGLAFVKQMLAAGHDPAYKLWMQCIDIDRTAALMCYIQLTLWNVPAQVIVGNTLTLDYREQWFTPAYWLFDWPRRFKFEKAMSLICEPPAKPDSADQCSGERPDSRTIKPGKFEQISLF